jgi:hypothetical protein
VVAQLVNNKLKKTTKINVIALFAQISQGFPCRDLVTRKINPSLGTRFPEPDMKLVLPKEQGLLTTRPQLSVKIKLQDLITYTRRPTCRTIDVTLDLTQHFHQTLLWTPIQLNTGFY